MLLQLAGHYVYQFGAVMFSHTRCVLADVSCQSKSVAIVQHPSPLVHSAALILFVAGEIHEGAPLVWSHCRYDIVIHQQWEIHPVVEESKPGSATNLSTPVTLQLSASGAVPGSEPLCVATPIPISLLA